MKKKIFLFLTAAVAVILLCGLSSFAATTYIIPRRGNIPVIDGDGSEAVWKDALKITLKSGTVGENDGWTSKMGKYGAGATIYVLWSKTAGIPGMYFLFEVNDPTPCLPSAYNAEDINAQDCVQIVFDPQYKRFTSVNDCALCFTCAPYTSSQKATQPYGYACWREHWYYKGGMIKALGIKMQSKLHYTDNVVTGYTIEMFIPFSALTINFRSIGDIEEYVTKIGIGFTLIDYTYSKSILDMGQYNEARYLNCITCDFGSSVETISNPSTYATLYFGSGTLPATTLHYPEEKGPTSSESGEVSRVNLEETINSVTNLKEANFTAETWSVMNEALMQAQVISKLASSTQEQIDTAQTELAASLMALKRTENTDGGYSVFTSQTTAEYLYGAVSVCLIIFIIGLVIFVVVLIRKKKRREVDK